MPSKAEFDNFLNSIGLSCDTKLTLEDVNCLKIYASSEEEKDDFVFHFFTNLAANDYRVIQKLSESIKSKRSIENQSFSISNRDALFAVLSCCDPLLLRYVLGKLQTLGIAVPLLLPVVGSSDVYFLRSALRPSFQHGALLDNVSKLYKCGFITVSAFRFGDLEFSKSDHLNQVLIKLKSDVDRSILSYTCFTSYMKDLERAIWLKGTVEATWYTSNQRRVTEGMPSFLLLNLRGNGLAYPRETTFCTLVSQINIVFISEYTDKILQKVISIAKTAYVIVLAKSGSKEETEQLLGETITIIYYKELPIAERTERLVKSLVGKLSTSTEHRKSSIDAASQISKLIGFIECEKYHEAKQLATTVDDCILYSLNDCKRQMFLFTKCCERFDSLNVSAISKDLCQEKLKLYTKAPLPKHLERFLEFFKFERNEQQAFLVFMHTLLEEKCCKACNELIKSYDESEKATELWKYLKLDKDNARSSEDTLFRNLNENSLRVEHFMRALWQLLRCSHPKVKSYFNTDTYHECVKTWLLNGNSIDLINFDSCHIPSAWTYTVLAALHSLQKDASVRVVSMFGAHGTQSFLLLNHMFRTNFTQTENMCLGGIRMQLIRVQNTEESSPACDYILLLNVNTVSPAETMEGSYSEMRRFHLTVMSSITDVLLIVIDSDDGQPDTSIIFDMVVHSVVKNACSVLDSCCFVYRVRDTETTTLADLHGSTLKMVRETCDKIDETEKSSSAQSSSEIHDLYEKIQDITSVKLVPMLQNNLPSNQNYVEKLYYLKQYVLQLLNRCRRKAPNFTQIGETVSTQTSIAFGEATSSPRSRFYKYINASVWLNQYFGDSFETIKQKISQNIVTAAELIARADDQQEAHNRKINEIIEFTCSEIEQLSKFLVCIGEHNGGLLEQCNTKNLYLANYKKTELHHYLPKKLKEAVKLAREKIKYDIILETKAKEVLDKIIQEQGNDSSSPSVDQYLQGINTEYPTSTISEIRSRTNREITDELKKPKYGSQVQSFIDKTSLTDWCVPLEFIKSTEDVRKVEKRFNVVDQRAEEALRECRKQLYELSCDHVKFMTNSKTATDILKDYLSRFQITADSIAMCIFLCIKFISAVHRNHVRADLKVVALSENEIDFETYIIKHAQPLNFPSLGSKIDHIVPLFDTLLSGDEFTFFTNAIRFKNVMNYDHVPFNLLSLQRLDRRFLQFLPMVSSQNMHTILQAVNDAKLYCLGRTIAKPSLNNEEFFSYLFKLIKHSLINGRDSEAIKAAAFLHVSAWSSALICAKEYEKENETNIAYRVQKLLPILGIGIREFVKQTVEEEFAQIVCNEIEDALWKCIPQLLQSKLRQYLLQKNCVYFLKRSLIGQMLLSFCKDDNFKEILSFVEDYDHCSNKWILLFVVKTINDADKSFIWKLKEHVIEESIASVIQAVNRSTSQCLENGEQGVLAWVQIFGTHFEHLDDNTFKHLDKNLQFNDIKHFSDHCLDILSSVKSRLTEIIEIPEKGNIDRTKTFLFSLSKNFYEELSSNIIGCVKQCPLCGIVCELDQISREYHSIFSHIPVGIKGGRSRESNELVSYTCPNYVSRDNMFTLQEDDDDEISKMLTVYHYWQVHDSENNSTLFWKYIFNRFNRQFAEYYECREGKIPQEWMSYSKEDAIRSVEKTYKLDHNDVAFL